MDKTAAGMDTDKKIGLVVIGRGCAIDQIHAGIIRARQHDPVFPLQLGCQYFGQAQCHGFFCGAVRSPGTGFIPSMAGIYRNNFFVGLE